MGWFGNLWNKVKKVGKSVWGGVKKVGKWVSDTGDAVKSGIGKAYNFVKGIPVIGNLVEQGLNKQIPYIGGLSVKDVAGIADEKFKQFKGVNEAIQKDDFVGAGMKAYGMAQGVPGFNKGIGKIKGKFM